MSGFSTQTDIHFSTTLLLVLHTTIMYRYIFKTDHWNSSQLVYTPHQHHNHPTNDHTLYPIFH